MQEVVLDGLYLASLPTYVTHHYFCQLTAGAFLILCDFHFSTEILAHVCMMTKTVKLLQQQQSSVTAFLIDQIGDQIGRQKSTYWI